jgi:hypothetical protein
VVGDRVYGMVESVFMSLFYLKGTWMVHSIVGL